MRFRQLLQDAWLLSIFILTLLLSGLGFLAMLWIFLIMLSAFE